MFRLQNFYTHELCVKRGGFLVRRINVDTTLYDVASTSIQRCMFTGWYLGFNFGNSLYSGPFFRV